MYCRITALLLAAVILAGPASAQEYEFQVIDVTGAIRTEAYDINDAGQVVGYYSAYDGLHGFVLYGTELTVLDVPPGPNTTAYGINSAGKIVGFLGTDSFLKDDTTVQLIRYPGSLPDTATIALGINDSDHVVGRYVDVDSQGFIKVGPTYTRIAVPGASLTEPTGINNGGDIVGNYISAGMFASFLLTGGTLHVLEVPSATLTQAHSINSAGQIAGTFLGADNMAHGFVLSGPSLSVIDVPGAVGPNYTQARGINDLGQVVGWFTDSSGTHGFIATPAKALQLKSLTLSKAETAGCGAVTGTVTLTRSAPAEGLTVNLSDTLASASTPATVKVLSGTTARTFTVKTHPVSASESGTVSATLDGRTLSQDLTLRPMRLASLTLSPTTVTGGKPVTGKATLECNAGPGPITVDLSSNNAGVASPVAASVVVSQGVKTANFDVTTNSVQARRCATISGTANGISKSEKLTVKPAAAVSPTSLKFANQKVRTTSAPLNVTLSNKGVIAFTVTSIGITGTNAASFTKSNSCPSTLSAGASCVIGVRFKPTATGSKTAKVTIATSATSTPLSVSLAGTAVSP
jgi:probable HAF family extracellular repeat protein